MKLFKGRGVKMKLQNLQGKIIGLAFVGLSGLVGLTSCVSSRSVELQLYDVSSQIEDAAIALKTKGVQQGLPLQNIYRSFDFNKNGTIDESESEEMVHCIREMVEKLNEELSNKQ